MAFDAVAYSCEIVVGMPRAPRDSKIETTIESISGLPVTRACVVASIGTLLCT